MNLKTLICCGALCSFLPLSAQAESGTFNTMTYNVAGLLELFSSAESDRQSATEQISCYLNDYDIVNVQEDFNYHAALYDTCNTHQYRTATTGGMGVGSGLNSLSHYAFSNVKRIGWNDCNLIDCLTPKGLTLIQVRLAEGVYVDIYNLHTQAQGEPNDLSARRSNIQQLVDYIEDNSQGNAVIVLGDTNTRYTRTGDNIRELLNIGFTDVWLELVRDGNIPGSGDHPLVCDPKITSAACEIVDKVFYRDNGYLNLQALDYEVRQDDVNAAGLKLSDHPPISTEWLYNLPANRKMSDMFGGNGGTSFNNITLLPEAPVVSSVSLRSGRRVDQVAISLANGQTFTHGGNGGSASNLSLNSGEYLTEVTLCSGEKSGSTRIFSASFETNQGNILSGGRTTSSCVTHNAPSNWQIVGFQGAAGVELDKLGVIYAPVTP